jgi:putative flippase GtrA
MAVLLAFPLPDNIRDLRGPLLLAALAFAFAVCFLFFWGCVWVSTAIGRFLGTTSPLALLGIGALIQLSLTIAGSAATWYASHLLTVHRVFVDAFEQTGAFIIAYLVYRALKPQRHSALVPPTRGQPGAP